MTAGLVEANRSLGRLALADVVAPAVELARCGVVMTPEVEYLHEILGPMLVHTPEARAIYAPAGRLHRAGERFRVPELADTFTEIVREGAAAMRTGPLADATLRHVDGDGLVTPEDLAGYRPIARVPLHVEHGDVTFLTNPPPSSGGILIAAALKAVDGDSARDDVGFYRTVAAAGVAANGLRDDAFVGGLQQDGFAERLLATVAASRKPTGTTHVSVMDADGGMASLSSSCGSGGGVVVPGTGILLNNMLGEEDLNPGGFGLLSAGSRMTSMMAPSLVVRGSEPVLAIGSAGSNRLRSAILQTLVSVVESGLDLAAAVRRPRIHPEGDQLDVEGGVPDTVCDALASDGYRLRRWQSMNLFFGGVAIAGQEAHGLAGAGDPRRGGAAAGVTRAGEVVDL
jgi:gamma-glutamyltranspeptidase/glutathione hydrolase